MPCQQRELQNVLDLPQNLKLILPTFLILANTRGVQKVSRFGESRYAISKISFATFQSTLHLAYVYTFAFFETILETCQPTLWLRYTLDVLAKRLHCIIRGIKSHTMQLTREEKGNKKEVTGSQVSDIRWMPKLWKRGVQVRPNALFDLGLPKNFGSTVNFFGSITFSDLWHWVYTTKRQICLYSVTWLSELGKRSKRKHTKRQILRKLSKFQ